MDGVDSAFSQIYHNFSSIYFGGKKQMSNFAGEKTNRYSQTYLNLHFYGNTVFRHSDREEPYGGFRR